MIVLRTLAVLVAVGLLAAATGSAHRHTDAWAPRTNVQDEILYLPEGRFLDAISLGYSPLVADLLWARSVLLFGDRFGDGSDTGWYSWLFHMIDLTTDIDPKFRAAYKYGGSMLRANGAFVDQSSIIFQKGMKALPNEWHFPFGIAMNYFMYKDDRAVAARYMAMAAARGSGPMYLRNLAASLYSESNQLEVALAFLEEEERDLPAGLARDVTSVKIYETKYLMAKRDAEAVIDDYIDRVGSFPPTLDALADVGLTLPEDPLRSTAALAHMGIEPPPPEGAGWMLDPDPEARRGSLVSRGHEHVFVQISRATGFGAQGLVDR